MATTLNRTKIISILCSQSNYMYFVSLMPMRCTIDADTDATSIVSTITGPTARTDWIMQLLNTFCNHVPNNSGNPNEQSAEDLLLAGLHRITTSYTDRYSFESIIAACGIKRLCAIPNLFKCIVSSLVTFVFRYSCLPCWFNQIAYGAVRMQESNTIVTVAQYVFERTRETCVQSRAFMPYKDVLAPNNADMCANMMLNCNIDVLSGTSRVAAAYKLRPFTVDEFNAACDRVAVTSPAPISAASGLFELMDPDNNHIPNPVMHHLRRIIRHVCSSERDMIWHLSHALGSRCIFKSMKRGELWDHAINAIACERASLSGGMLQTIDAMITTHIKSHVPRHLLKDQARRDLWIRTAYDTGLVASAAALKFA